MRVIKTKKKSSHTVWSPTDVACVVLACVIAAFVVVCASRAMGGPDLPHAEGRTAPRSKPQRLGVKQAFRVGGFQVWGWFE